MTPTLPEAVRIVEVGPRDGLQNEARPVSTTDKVRFITALAAAGLNEIEVTAFVHPQRIPQLADAAEVCAALPVLSNVRWSALVPNERGLERAIAAGLPRIALFTAVSETFTQRNIGMSIGESLSVYGKVARQAAAAGLSVRGYLSCCFVCPYEGRIAPERVAELAAEIQALGADEVVISDTLGAATPRDVFRVLSLVLARVPVERVALHLHDTYGTALANVLAGLQVGLTTFDASTGGLGGCPFAPGAAGNLATEDLVYMLHGMGIRTGVDPASLHAAAETVAMALGREMTSRQWRLRSSGSTTL